MRIVEWTDKHGWKHLSLLRDDDPVEMAPHGVPCDPPDITQLDWDIVKRELHNQLVERRLSNWRDVQKQRNGLQGAVLATLRRPLIMLYKMKEAHNA
jgi:hypothetical protein